MKYMIIIICSDTYFREFVHTERHLFSKKICNLPANGDGPSTSLAPNFFGSFVMVSLYPESV